MQKFIEIDREKMRAFMVKEQSRAENQSTKHEVKQRVALDRFEDRGEPRDQSRGERIQDERGRNQA
jgi:hypothetical protein